MLLFCELYSILAPILHFESVNAHESRTLLLIHAALSSSQNWALRALLRPSPPSGPPIHGRSAPIPFNTPNPPALLADLVTKEAEKGEADFVGMLLGGYEAVYAAQEHVNVVGNGVFP